MKERNDYTINHIYIYNDIQENGERDKLEKECGQKLNADAALNYIPRILFIFSFISRENFDMLQYSSKRKLKKIPSPNLLYSPFIANEARADKREPQANAETRIRERIAMHETISAATNTSSRHSFAMLDEPPIYARFRLYSRFSFSSRYSYYYFHSRQPL